MKMIDFTQADAKTGIIGIISSWVAAISGVINVSATIDTAIGAAVVTLVSLIVSFFGNRWLRKYYEKKDKKKAEREAVKFRSNGKA